ncbi:metal dependent phosphohydrolase [Kosmotoga olearia TBF 19.5.1]|uniref:Metal dependent phosphohydrolase n=2 Tax=Kosmotoga TaxID=651456 RepID=C5CEX6_KOSOT|nr:metal dependent phosphohydrolase [Kosmotoga olearia TBF 19.5.1]
MKIDQGKGSMKKDISNLGMNLSARRLNRILSILFSEMKDLSDEDRDLPIRWNVIHMYTSSQIAKILALKRGIDPELAGIAAALHDIGVVKTKRHKNHAEAAERYVYEIIESYNSKHRGDLPQITKEEAELIVNAIVQHSQKEIISDNPFVEILKDVDSLDRYLHGVKTEGTHRERCIKVLKELGIEENLINRTKKVSY